MKKNKFSSHTWLPYLTPNGVTHLNNTRIEEFSAFVIVGYQLFTVSFFLSKPCRTKFRILNTYPLGVRMARENSKKGFGVNFGFSGNNDSDIIPKTSRYHPEGRGLVKMSVLKGRGI